MCSLFCTCLLAAFHMQTAGIDPKAQAQVQAQAQVWAQARAQAQARVQVQAQAQAQAPDQVCRLPVLINIHKAHLKDAFGFSGFLDLAFLFIEEI